MTGHNLPGWQYDPSAGSTGEARMTGGAAVATFIATAGGLGSTSGLLTVTPDGQGGVRRGVDARVAATTGLTAMAAAASGAAAFSQIAGPGGAVAGTVLGMIGTAVNGGLAAYDAQGTKATLLEIQKYAIAATRTGEKGEDIDAVLEALDFCIHQQGVKFAKGVANTSIVGQPLLIGYKTGRALQKWADGTKGVARDSISRQLVEISKKPDGTASAPGLARRIIAAVVAKNYDSIMQDAVSNAMKTG
jgi:hypothetical protein